MTDKVFGWGGGTKIATKENGRTLYAGRDMPEAEVKAFIAEMNALRENPAWIEEMMVFAKYEIIEKMSRAEADLLFELDKDNE